MYSKLPTLNKFFTLIKDINFIPFVLLFFILAITGFPLYAQNNEARNVRGEVVDAQTHHPLVGVSVYIEGTQTGTVTDVSGHYSIKAKPGQSLVFSFLGYGTKHVKITNGTGPVNIELQPTSQLLNEMVVIGYGSLKKTDVSGAISQLQNHGLDRIPVTSTALALSGQLPGVQVQSTGLEVGQNPTIVIRGVSSITTSSEPLVVVDGYPVPDGLNAVQMADVASISVLKGPAAAAIYGSRASNGVIIITTKSGVPGKTHFHISSYVGINQAYPIRQIFPMPKQWVDWVNTYSQQHNIPIPPDEQAKLNAMLSLGTATNWQKLCSEMD